MVLVNRDVVRPHHVPALFRGKNWLVLESPVDIFEYGFHEGYNIASKWIAINFLMIDSDTALVEDRQESLISLLEF